jgi:ATP/maltotriose-dependent transcriptional regulator MalT
MPALANELLQRLSTSHIIPPVTQRQQQVWACVACGLTDGEAARDLDVSPSTVRGHVASLERALFDPLEIAGSRPLLIVYFWLHTGCCTRGLLESVKTA